MNYIDLAYTVEKDKVEEKVKEITTGNEYRVANIVPFDEDNMLLCLTKAPATNQGYQPKQLGEMKPRNRAGEPATTRQLNYIRQLANKADKDPASLNLDNLTKKDAGRLIGRLKKEQKVPKDQEDLDFGQGFDMSELDQMNFGN